MKAITCEREDCFGNVCGVFCEILAKYPSDGIKKCPFYKTLEQYKKNQKKAHDHLEKIGRGDLIDKYEYNKERKW